MAFCFAINVSPPVPADSFQFQSQHPIQQRPLLCCNRLACMDQVLIKTDGDILLHGKTSLFTRRLRIAQPQWEFHRKESGALSP
jgi:hypothetical protein